MLAYRHAELLAEVESGWVLVQEAKQREEAACLEGHAA